jgi:hypothetical protein
MSLGDMIFDIDKDFEKVREYAENLSGDSIAPSGYEMMNMFIAITRKIEQLDKKVTKLSDRIDGICEINQIWDGQ